MTIEKWENLQGGVTLHLGGRIDTSSFDQLRQAIADVPAENHLTLDFRDVPYISSAGLRELLVCRKRFPGDQLRLINVAQEVMDIFKMTGFDSMLPIETAENDVSTYINLSFKELLARRVQDRRDCVALRCERGNFSWRDIDRASQIIAADLSRMGAKVGTRIGLCGTNSENWIFTFFAVQKLGAMAMLINPAQSAAEIGRVCAIGDVDILCFGEIPAMSDPEDFKETIRNCPGSNVREFYSIRTDVDLRSRFAEYEAVQDKFAQEIDPDAPCVVIFTSGSTGRPKGVILSAYNLLNASAVQVRLQRVTEADKSLLIVPLFHILGLVVSFLPGAMTGAELVIPDDIHTKTLIETMKKEKCTLMHSVPTLILALLNNPDFDADAFSCLRCTLLAGSAATEAQLRMFGERLPDNHFIVAYGLSEMAPVSETLYEDTKEHLLRTVGKPVENIRVKIVNRETGEDCPAGETGEILVQGFNLMTGYYKLPLEDQAIDGEGWLHTGDMGSLDADGYLILSGRYKELIIRGGENIMPKEVEAAIAAIPGVDDVKVLGVPSDFFGEEVAACVKLLPDAVWEEAKVRSILAKTLARFKVPRWFYLYDQFPVLGSGKIDMAALKRDVQDHIQKL